MCARTIAKYLLFFANVLFLLAGVALLGVGIAFKVGYNKIIDAIPEEYNFQLAPTASIVIGAVIFVIAFLGCCGAIKESNWMLVTYGLILLALLVVQIAIGVYALVEINREDSDLTLESATNRTLTEIFQHYDPNDDDSIVNYIQRQFECCGPNGPQFFAGGVVPPSCCRSDVTICVTQIAFQTSCVEAVFSYLQTTMKIVGGVIIGLVVTELIGTIFSCGLASSVRSRGKHY